MIITLSFGRLIYLLFELFATKNHEFVISKPITTLIFLYKQRYKPTQSDKVIRCLCVCHICPFLKGCGDICLSLKQLCPACAVYGMHNCTWEVLSSADFEFHFSSRVQSANDTHAYLWERNRNWRSLVCNCMHVVRFDLWCGVNQVSFFFWITSDMVNGVLIKTLLPPCVLCTFQSDILEPASYCLAFMSHLAPWQ